MYTVVTHEFIVMSIAYLEENNMKKLALLFIIVILAFVSCKQANFEEKQGDYGTVVFDLTESSNLRAIDQSTALPDLLSSKMKIFIERDGRMAEEKEFRSGDKKQYKGTFSIGSKIKFTAVVISKSVKWKGSIKHTVTSGMNHLNLKLKKSASSLEPLKFKLVNNEFSLGFFGENSFLNNEGVSNSYASLNSVPSFCRDQKGRTYVLYNDNSTNEEIQFKRYTSEGVEDTSFIRPSITGQKMNLGIASDHKTGNIFVSYMAGGTGYSISLLKEKPLGAQAELRDISPSSFVYNIHSMAVYNDIIAIIEFGNDYKLYLYKFNGEDKPISKITDKIIDKALLNINIKGSTSPNPPQAKIMDCFMNDKNIYILCNCYTKYSPYVSTGTILKVSYTEEKGTLNIEQAIKLIGKDEYVAENNIVNVQDETKELYGPMKFVGFDEDVLYIADDGVVREYEGGAIQLIENKNRLVCFNLKDEKIFIENKDSNIETWMPENMAITKINGTIFFSYDRKGINEVAKIKIFDGSKFAKFDNSDVLTIENPDTTLVYVFDLSGNFYVRTKDGNNVDILKKYSPYKTENGIEYKENTEFKGDGLPDVSSSNSILSLYYDGMQKHLYYKVGHDLYKLVENSWVLVDKGSYTFTRYMAIHDGKITFYNNGIKTIDIKDGKLEGGEKILSDPIELRNGNNVIGICVYNNISYFLYKDSNGKLYALVMDSDKRTAKTEALFKVDSYIADLNEIRPIGFDEKTNELKFFFDEVREDYDGRIEANLNKYISLKYTDSMLSATTKELPSDDITWYEEGKVWEGASDAIMLWKTQHPTTPVASKPTAKYYGVSDVTATLGSFPSLASSTSPYSYDVYDVFCYDQAGNLYVLIGKGGSYYVVRFEVTENKDYNLNHLKTKIDGNAFDNWKSKFKVSASGTNFDPKSFVMAVYSDSPKSGVLYYRYFDSHNKIRINKKTISAGEFDSEAEVQWLGFGSNEIDSYYEESGQKIERQFMSMVANKDGLFIAQKELVYQGGYNNKYYKSYNIEIRKYLSTNDNYASPDAKIDIVGKASERIPTKMFKDNPISYDNSEAQWNEYIRENISDMYAYNGVLYALSYKEEGGQAFPTESINSNDRALKNMSVSGKLLKVGNSTSNFENGVTVIKESNSKPNETGMFAPSHIIGILPNQLVIASDGYYGSTDSNNKRTATNYNMIYFLTLKADDGNLKIESKENKEAYFNLEYQEEVETDLSKEWKLKN